VKIPTTLKHKPVISIENYENVDGKHAYHSDAKGLSLGLAQWNDRGNVSISAKVWRYSGERWSRQSEELPLHRVLDLALLIGIAKGYFTEASRYPKLYDENNTKVYDIGLQGDAMRVEICTENPMLDTDIQLFHDALAQEEEYLSPRLHLLANLLNDLGYGRNGSKK